MYGFLNPTNRSLFHLEMSGVKSTRLGQIMHVSWGEVKSVISQSLKSLRNNSDSIKSHSSDRFIEGRKTS